MQNYFSARKMKNTIIVPTFFDCFLWPLIEFNLLSIELFLPLSVCSRETLQGDDVSPVKRFGSRSFVDGSAILPGENRPAENWIDYHSGLDSIPYPSLIPYQDYSLFPYLNTSHNHVQCMPVNEKSPTSEYILASVRLDGINFYFPTQFNAITVRPGRENTSDGDCWNQVTGVCNIRGAFRLSQNFVWLTTDNNRITTVAPLASATFVILVA